MGIPSRDIDTAESDFLALGPLLRLRKNREA